MRARPSLAIATRALASTGKGETGEAKPRRGGAGPELAPEGATPPPSLPPPVTPPPEERGGGGKSVALIVGGATLSAVGIGVGIGLLVASSGAASDRDAIREEIGGGAGVCGGGTPFETECAEITSLDGDASAFGVVGAVSIGIGATVGVATLVYALWPESEAASAAAAVRFQVAPEGGAASFRTSF